MSSENIRLDMFGFPRLNYVNLARNIFPVQPLPPGAIPDYGWKPPEGALEIMDKKDHKNENDK
jgi:hypothetical protein